MQLNIFKRAIYYFLGFHKGAVNIVLHVIGFVGMFYSISKLDLVLFTIFLVMLESGHAYNHFAKIKSYDFRPHVLFWRLFIFILVVFLFYILTLKL